jgi:hypothetical protein
MRRIPKPGDVQRAAELARLPPVPATLVVPAWTPDSRFDGAVARAAHTVEASAPGFGGLPAQATVVVAVPDPSARPAPAWADHRDEGSATIYVVYVGADGRARSVHHLSNAVALPLAPHDWPPAVAALFSGVDS